MNVSLKYTTALALGFLMIGLALGRWAAPAKVVTKTETIHDSTDHSVVTRTQEKKVDGTVVTTTVVHKDIEQQAQTSSEKIVTRDSPKWFVSGLIGTEIGVGALPKSPLYGIGVQYRIGGPFFIGAQGIKLDSGALGMASVGIQF